MGNQGPEAGHRAPARRGGTGQLQRAAPIGAGLRHSAGRTGSAFSSLPAELAALCPGPAVAAMPHAGLVTFFPADTSREPGKSGAALDRSAAALHGAAAAGREMGLAARPARTAPQRCGPRLPAGVRGVRSVRRAGGACFYAGGPRVLQWCEYTGMWARYCKRACVCIHGRVQALGFLYGVA